MVMALKDIIKSAKPDLKQFEYLYKQIHQDPELSGCEVRTSSVIADFLQRHDFEVHEKIGGHGVVGVFKNGPGKVVMLRAELDALPIKEETQLTYASDNYMKDEWGQEQPVSHACGHDMHIVCLLAAAKLLIHAKSEWSGTLVVLFQPNEEHTGGARAMIEDGLYEKIPVPDVIMAQHGMPIRTGQVSIKPGPVLVSADIVKIRIFSSKGHHANPQINIDPVIVASKIILSLQDIAKKIAGNEFASIQVEQIHAGEEGADWVKHADIILDVKAFDPDIRTALLTAIRGVTDSEHRASGAIQPPKITSTVRAPLTSNDEHITNKVRDAFKGFFGSGNVLEEVPNHPCEDFSILASSHNVPYVFWFLGRVHPDEMDIADKENKLLDMIPIEHSPYYHPVIKWTLDHGMTALAVAALRFLRDDSQKS